MVLAPAMSPERFGFHWVLLLNIRSVQGLPLALHRGPTPGGASRTTMMQGLEPRSIACRANGLPAVIPLCLYNTVNVRVSCIHPPNTRTPLGAPASSYLSDTSSPPPQLCSEPELRLSLSFLMEILCLPPDSGGSSPDSSTLHDLILQSNLPQLLYPSICSWALGWVPNFSSCD